MGDTIRYPNMGTIKKAAEIYGLSRPTSGGCARRVKFGM